MKTQQHNQGNLKELKVKIEEKVVDSIAQMAESSNMSVDDIVVIALKRFRASHAELEGKVPKLD
jgi:fructose-1,6-bisphosphatase/sedoheptulose 1,7-bisphosphatase-like protein